jgi:hypothetical protein
VVEEEPVQPGDPRLVEPAHEEREGHREGVEDREEHVGERRAEVAGELAPEDRAEGRAGGWRVFHEREGVRR